MNKSKRVAQQKHRKKMKKLNVKLSAEMGADRYVTEPFSLEELLGVIAEFLPCSE